ncbi:MAG TPA: hypothetical protein PLM33_05960 [Acidobacteriota bacterium]|jgi:hypothetical protein|nr:hypothetical protein [Acidobacteriota bacterium]HRR25082.1 hypothetical protein [Acidobacteriota bacterium]HRR55508.1 hypothetical protein [Acidobacteriota bacterium]HRV07089.1 hypothetical protein [Acidobacteriota bacterium]
MLQQAFRYSALFCFVAASFGFLFFRFRYSRRSPERLWGIRISHLMGFVGLLFHRLWLGEMNEVSFLILASLLVSLLGFEISEYFLR